MLRTEDGEAIYRRCPTATTTTWSAAVRPHGEVEGLTGRVDRAIAAEHGFDDVSHTLRSSDLRACRS